MPHPTAPTACTTEQAFEHSDAEVAVVFVDMAGFTALTESFGDHHAAQLAETFATLAHDALGPGDELVKSIGDAVLVTSEDRAAAVRFLERLAEATEGVGRFPPLRAGVSAGSVVKRRGDVFGATVNTAARLSALARPGQIVATRDVATAARPGWEPSVDRVRLRNVAAPVDIVRLEFGSPRHVA